jgi:hypothetical protein
LKDGAGITVACAYQSDILATDWEEVE